MFFCQLILPQKVSLKFFGFKIQIFRFFEYTHPICKDLFFKQQTDLIYFVNKQLFFILTATEIFFKYFEKIEVFL